MLKRDPRANVGWDLSLNRAIVEDDYDFKGGVMSQKLYFYMILFQNYIEYNFYLLNKWLQAGAGPPW